MSCKLKVLSLIIHSEDLTFLDVDRWEKNNWTTFISIRKILFPIMMNLPYIIENQINLIHHFEMNDDEYLKLKSEMDTIGMQLVHIEKDDRQYNVINSFLEISKSSQLIVPYIPHDELYELAIMDITNALNVTQYYHLEITELNIFASILSKIIDLLRELITLSINTLLMESPKKLRDEELLILDSVKEKSKIVKVYVGEMIDIEEAYFLMKLGPYMEIVILHEKHIPY